MVILHHILFRHFGAKARALHESVCMGCTTPCITIVVLRHIYSIIWDEAKDTAQRQSVCTGRTIS